MMTVQARPVDAGMVFVGCAAASAMASKSGLTINGVAHGIGG
jgi:hypothetical protein